MKECANCYKTQKIQNRSRGIRGLAARVWTLLWNLVDLRLAVVEMNNFSLFEFDAVWRIIERTVHAQ